MQMGANIRKFSRSLGTAVEQSIAARMPDTKQEIGAQRTEAQSTLTAHEEQSIAERSPYSKREAQDAMLAHMRAREDTLTQFIIDVVARPVAKTAGAKVGTLVGTPRARRCRQRKGTQGDGGARRQPLRCLGIRARGASSSSWASRALLRCSATIGRSMVASWASRGRPSM